MEAWLNMYQEKIIDITTGKETIRPYTKKEIAEVEAAIEATRLEQDTKAQAQLEKDAARQEILERLGISKEESKLLLG
jgi:hypothetical protein